MALKNVAMWENHGSLLHSIISNYLVPRIPQIHVILIENPLALCERTNDPSCSWLAHSLLDLGPGEDKFTRQVVDHLLLGLAVGLTGLPLHERAEVAAIELDVWPSVHL